MGGREYFRESGQGVQGRYPEEIKRKPEGIKTIQAQTWEKALGKKMLALVTAA